MAVEDFTNDDVDGIQLDPNFNGLKKSDLLESQDKVQSKTRRFLFWTRKFDYDGLEDRLKASSLDLQFNHVEGSSMSDFPDGGNKGLQPGRLRHSSWVRQLNAGLLKDWSTSSDTYEELPDRPPLSLSTQGRWWSPVAVLSDLRPNIQYHRGTAGDAAHEDGGPDIRTLHCRHGCPVTISAVVDGRQFQGRGKTAKQAKQRLAADVLSTLFHFRFIGQKPGLSPQPTVTYYQQHQ